MKFLNFNSNLLAITPATGRHAILIYLLLFQITAMKGQNSPNEESADYQEMMDLVQKFMNRTKQPILTKELLDSLPDNEIEQAIIDSMHLKMDKKMTKELIILENSSIGRKTVYTTSWLEAEVRNGGFNQYFFNSNGEYIPYLKEGLKELSDDNYTELVTKAIKLYEQEIGRQHDSQDGSMEEFMDSYEDNPLNELDEEFYRLNREKPFSDIRLKYIKNNYKEFVEK
jgi:hypothetical protein